MRYLIKDLEAFQASTKQIDSRLTDSSVVSEYINATEELTNSLECIHDICYESKDKELFRIILKDIKSIQRHLENGSSLPEMRFPVQNLFKFYYYFYDS